MSTATIQAPSTGTYRQMYIDGQWCDAQSGKRLTVINPATEDGIAEVAFGGKQECARVGRHMQPVGDQRDRAEHRAAGDLGDHHERRQRDDTPSAPLVRRVMLAEEGVIVRPLIDRVRMCSR